jgi:hypothetical protein
VLGQAANVVVGFDLVGSRRISAGALDHVGVQSALRKVVDFTEVNGNFFEDLNELSPNRFPFYLWISHALERTQESFCAINKYQVHTQLACENVLNSVGLTFSHQAVIDKYAGKAITDGPVN